MRSHAKASSAGSNLGQGSHLGSLRRGAFATCGTACEAGGSGAPSHRARIAALCLVALVFAALINASSALASKEVFNYFGTAAGGGSFGNGLGTLGGEFNKSRGIAVNDTGSGPADPGDTYVVDEANNRVERFDSGGNFVSAWGKDVVAPTVNEQQRIFINAGAGTYTLTFNGASTAAIPYNTGSQVVDNALDLLPTIGGDANVDVAGGFGGPYTVTFKGPFAASDQPEMSADAGQLVGTIEIATVANGTATTANTGTGYELCTAATQCQEGAASGENGALSHPQSVAVDEDTGNVYVSDRDNFRIDEYDGAGNFIASFGFGVDATTAGSGYEVCLAADVCQAGTPGEGAGQIGSTAGAEFSGSATLGIAVSPADGNAATGTAFLADSKNRRVNTYKLDGSSPSSFGSSATFGEIQPRAIAVDSRGIVYASNSNGGAEIERYDSQNANGGGTVFLAPIEASRNERQTITFSGYIHDNYFRLSCPNGQQTGLIRWTPDYQILQYVREAFDSPGCEARASALGSDPFTTLTVEFEGPASSSNVPTMSCTTEIGSGSCSVSTEQNGQLAALLNAGSLPQIGTNGLAVDPDSDGGGPDSDTLYVLRSPKPGNTVVQQFGPTNKPGLAAAPNAVDDTHGSGAEFVSATSLGLNSANGQLFVSSPSDNAGGSAKDGVYVLADPASIPKPVLTLDPVTVKTDTTATLTGTVDPKGGLVGCKFQYSTDQLGWIDVPAPGCARIPTASGAQPVKAVATGLDPNTHYFVRLAVSRPFVLNSTAISATVRSFDTDAPPPVISDVGAIQVTDTSARLIGTIDPRHSATGYVFEYGTTPALGSSTKPLNIGGGNKPVTVSQVIGGLGKDTDYYFRVVATNLTGTTASTGRTFHTRPLPVPPSNEGNCANEARRAEQRSALPECRAYEMATPPDKNQGGVDQYFIGEYAMALSRGGEAATYCTNALFGEPAGQSAAQCAPYLSRRTPTGWQTSDPFPRQCAPGDNNGFSGGLSVLLNGNFDRALELVPESSYCPIPLIDPSAPDQSFNLYRQDLSTEPSGFDLVTPTQNKYNGSEGPLVGGSDDFNHVVFKSFANQTADSPAPGNFTKIYDWELEGHGACVTPGGCMSLVTKNPSGEPFTTRSETPLGHSGSPIPSSISADGNRIFFYNGVGLSQTLYMREDNSTTYKLSAPECAVPADCSNTSSDTFIWADESGDVALFTSCDKLTDGSEPCLEGSSKLYRWDRNAPPAHRLTDLSLAVTHADGSRAFAQAIVGASDDGSIVYLIAGGGNGGDQVYRIAWNGGSPTAEHLARFQGYEFPVEGSVIDFNPNNTLSENPNVVERIDRVSADGKYVTLTTPLRLDPAADRDEDLDAYRWGEGEGWTCVSCQLPGAVSAGSVNTMVPECCEKTTSIVLNAFDEDTHAISEDGQRVFFTATDALVPEDVNGEVGCPRVRTSNHSGQVYACQDVYEWHDGTVSLISSGTGTGGSTFLGADPSGQDVAFITHDRLVGWDTDNGTDIYDARIGGGFPEPKPAPPQCDLNAGACEGPATVAPSTTGAGSAVFEGPSNPNPSHKKAPRKHGKRHHKQQKRHDRRGHSRAANHNRRAHR